MSTDLRLSLTLDPTDFPVLALPRERFAVQLMPVTKVQFEYMLGDAGRTDPVTPETYEAMVAANPRASWRTAVGRPESLFATAITPEEAAAFGRWLGRDFRLPTDAEWRTLDAALVDSVGGSVLRPVMEDLRVHPAARAILADVFGSTAQLRWREVAMLDHGLLEWVRTRDGFGLQGRPRPELYRLIHNPQVHEAVRVRHTPIPRHRAFGFRLVRPLPPRGGP